MRVGRTMGREVDKCNIPAFLVFCMRLRFSGRVFVGVEGLGGSELGVCVLVVGGMRSNRSILHIRYSSRTMQFFEQVLSKHLIINYYPDDKAILAKIHSH